MPKATPKQMNPVLSSMGKIKNMFYLFTKSISENGVTRIRWYDSKTRMWRYTKSEATAYKTLGAASGQLTRLKRLHDTGARLMATPVETLFQWGPSSEFSSTWKGAS